MTFTEDKDFAQGIHQAVDDNAVILEQVIARLMTVEQQLYVTIPETGQITADVKIIKQYVEQEDARIDKALRLEPNSMTAQLESKNAELMIKLAALEGIVSQAQLGGGEPPGLAAPVGLKNTVAAMEEQFRITLPKIVGIDETQNNVQRKLLDMACGSDKIKVEMVEQMSRV